MSSDLAAGRDPFGGTTDAAAYVPRAACERVLERLIEALRGGARRIALTGPTGIGKTQLLRVLAQRLEQEAQTLILPYAAVEFDDLCHWSLGLLGEGDGPFAAPGQSLLQVARRRSGGGRMLILVLDDASGLPSEAARQLSQLVEQAEGALRLIVVPADAPRAGRVLGALGRNLLEVRFNTPMTLDETTAYVEARLARAAIPADIEERFDEAAIRWLHRESGGLPRELHTLALSIERGQAHTHEDTFLRSEQWLEIEAGAPETHGLEGGRDALAAALVEEPTAEPDPHAPTPPAAPTEPTPSPPRAPRAEQARSGKGWVLGAAALAVVLMLVWRMGGDGPPSDLTPPVAPLAAEEGAPAELPTEASEVAGLEESAASEDTTALDGPVPIEDTTAPDESSPIEAAALGESAAIAEEAAEVEPIPVAEDPVPVEITADHEEPIAVEDTATNEPAVVEVAEAEEPIAVEPSAVDEEPVAVPSSAAAEEPAVIEPTAVEEPVAVEPRAADEPPVAAKTRTAAGEAAPVEVVETATESSLEPAPPSLDERLVARPGTVELRLEIPDGARLDVDGRPAGKAPVPPLYLAPGIHRFRIVFPDGHVRNADRVIEGERQTLRFDA